MDHYRLYGSANNRRYSGYSGSAISSSSSRSSYTDSTEPRFLGVRNRNSIRSLPEFGLCNECQKPRVGVGWCRQCNNARFCRRVRDWTSSHLALDRFIIQTQLNADNVHSFLEWIPFIDFKHVSLLDKGGYSSVYKARWVRGCIVQWDTSTKSWKRFGEHEVVIKVIKGSRKSLGCFVNELSAYHRLNLTLEGIHRCYGLTLWPKTGDFAVVTEYARDGDLGQYIRKNADDFPWMERLIILRDIAVQLDIIHNSELVHHDLHPGNILLGDNNTTVIDDFGLSWRRDRVFESNTEKILAVLPYKAPEILNGVEYTCASDVYSFGIIMSELASLKRPFHFSRQDPQLVLDICNGLRPEIARGTPQCFIDLMKACWHRDHRKRPTASVILQCLDDWIHSQRRKLWDIYDQFEEAERYRKDCRKRLERHSNYRNSLYHNVYINHREEKK